MEHPPTITCSKCNLYKAHPGNIYQLPLKDERIEAASRPRVLFVLNYPSETEANKHAYFSDGKEWVLDYLVNSTFEWQVTSLVLCYPGKKGQTDGFKPIKPTAKQYECCSSFFYNCIEEFQPQVIVALGGDVLGRLWPTDRGAAPSINKARLTPVKTADGRWLVTGYDPYTHAQWLRSGGKDGTDLTEEYIRLFTLLHEITDGTYKPQEPVEWSLVQTAEELAAYVQLLESKGVTKLYIDDEHSTWVGSQVHPYKEDPECALGDKLNLFQPDVKLMCLGVTAIEQQLTKLGYDCGYPVIDKIVYHTVVILPQAWSTNPCLLYQLINNRSLEAWNILSDAQALYQLTDGMVDILEGEFWFPDASAPMPLNCTIDDGWFYKGLQDQSTAGNGLKQSCTEGLGIPPWDNDLNNALARVKEDIQKKNHVVAKVGGEYTPMLVSMDMTPLEVWAPYNACDTAYHARLREEKVHAGSVGADFPWAVYRMLIDGLGWIATMERNGVPIDYDLFVDTLERLRTAEEDYVAAFARIPEVQQACKESGKSSFNTRSPHFMDAFVKALHGQAEFDAFPRTKSGRLCSDAEMLTALAGEDPLDKVPWESKTRAQRIWTRVQEWKKSGDDYSRLLGLHDYVVHYPGESSRIHPQFRMLRIDMEDGDDSEASGGAKSGRIVASPNVLNLWERIKPIFSDRVRRRVMLIADYGRIELAWIAWNSKDPLMMQWSNEFKDQHEERGRAMFEARTGGSSFFWEGLDKDVRKGWRAKGKTQNFATIYQEEPETTAAKNLMTLEQVIADLELGRRLHPKIYEFMCEVYDRCQAGEKIKACFGRLRSPRKVDNKKGLITWQKSSMTAEQFFSFDPGLRHRRNQGNAAIFRSVWNTIGAQADASDTTYCAGKRIHMLLTHGNWLDRNKVEEFNYQYDSLQYLVPEDYAAEAARAIQQVMMDIPNLGLPAHFGLRLPVDVKVGENLSETAPGHLRDWDVEKGCYASP